MTGYAIFKAYLARDHALPKRLPRRILMVWTIIVANMADIDFILPLLFGVSDHRGFTHSLFFGFCFSFLVALAIFALYGPPLKKLALFSIFIYASHLFLDFFTAGGRGIPLLWPFSEVRFISTLPIFPGVHHSEGLFHLGHAVFITYEAIYSILLIKITHSSKFRAFWKNSKN